MYRESLGISPRIFSCESVKNQGKVLTGESITFSNLKDNMSTMYEQESIIVGWPGASLQRVTPVHPKDLTLPWKQTDRQTNTKAFCPSFAALKSLGFREESFLH